MIAQFELAVLAKLAWAGAPIGGGESLLGYKYQTLESYPDDWGAYFEDEKVAARPPAAWVTFDGFTGGEEQASGAIRYSARFWLVVAAKNLRNETATRHGGSGEPGSYQLATDAVALLAGQTLGLDIDRIAIPQIREVSRTDALRKRKLSLYAVQLVTAMTVDPLSVDDGDLAPFETFHANWDIPAFGGVGPDLPDDAAADATDNLSLEGDQS
ncbi:phage protein Gp37 [Sphingorhabdus sp. 109]|uniref:phage protein Gp37 n=1 Tax=Sphingorhabdus sp. 109 TaxID=2653173 RepID=UPI0012F21BFA|nr:phage protein Gp37 [Sphingorhabdus sp. 109]VWX62590.1 Phage gp37-like protein [Sphingorhabdus sp. 109]